MSKIKDTNRIPAIIQELSALSSKKIKVGIVGSVDSKIVSYAAANEFGAEIRPKSAKALVIPVIPEARGKSPRDISGLTFVSPRNPSGGSAGVLAETYPRGGIKKVWYILRRKVTIPERSFLRSTFDDKDSMEFVAGKVRRALDYLYQGKINGKGVITTMGESAVSAVRSKIAGGITPPNTEVTVAVKGAGKGVLRDSGDLIKSINWMES